ncbi:MAG: class I SAM-dependent DNA methyltransferase [Acidobacteriota bacterium]
MNNQTDKRLETIRADYDSLAKEYAERLFRELEQKPLDCELLRRFAVGVRDSGKVGDFGCGPGHVARFLDRAGVTMCGLDLSPGMVDQARRLSPEIDFRVGNMLALDLPDGALAGITAFYCIVNLAPDLLPSVFAEMARVLAPGGLLLLAFHMGNQDGGGHAMRPGELWGNPVKMEFYFHPPAQVERLLRAAGFEIEETIEREPYAPHVEYQTRRAYLFARKMRPRQPHTIA